MSDASASKGLRSNARLVVIEAPAGCGKTRMGSEYAREAAMQLRKGFVLVLTHTHAACDVFAARTRAADSKIDIRTVDSLICQIAGAYHSALGLPADASSWARTNGQDGYQKLGIKVAQLLRNAPFIGEILALRYPIMVCDEHQDSSECQHAVAMALYAGGASLRVFGDMMQRIYRKSAGNHTAQDDAYWSELRGVAGVCETLSTPHRWPGEAAPLGQWLLNARETLKNGGQIDLRAPLPPGVAVVYAENLANYGYRLAPGDRRRIDAIVDSAPSLLMLSAQRKSVDDLRACFARSIPIWEGHTREDLGTLVREMQAASGDASAIAASMVSFVQSVGSGFSASEYGNRLCEEVAGGCASRRSGKPAQLQDLGRLILAQPNHKGVAQALRRLHGFTKSDGAFRKVKIDHKWEFRDAVSLGDFDDPDGGLTEIARRRTYARPSPPARSISTIHKAKGLECDNVIVVPCDAQHFANKLGARCLLYVAMSRAKRSLTLVVSRQKPSPLILI